MASALEILLLAQISFLNNRPHFRGSFATATSLTANSNLPYPVLEDNYSAWNSTSHYWVVPTPGLYIVDCQYKWSPAATSAPAIKVFGGASNSQVELWSPNAPSNAQFDGLNLVGTVRANAGDQISVQTINAFTTMVDGTNVNNNYLDILYYSA